MSGPSRNRAFFTSLAMRIGERGVTAIGVFMNSVLIARTLADQEAAAYFVVVSVCQLVVAPWVAGADYVWIRFRSSGAEPADATAQVVSPVVWGSLFSSLLAVLACALLLAGRPAYGLMLTSVFGNFVFSVITLHLASKFGQPARYLVVSVLGGGVAIAFKLAVLMLAPGEAWTYAALFAEFYLIAVLAIVLRPGPSAVIPPGTIRRFLRAFAGPAFLAISTIVSLRFVLLVASRVLEQADYVAFGLAFQVMNAVSVFSVAVSHSIVATSLSGDSAGAGLLSATRRGFVGAVALFLGFAGFLYEFGAPVLGFLLKSRGAGVHALVMSGLLYSASVLVHGICNALASMTDAARSYSWVLIGASLLNAAVLALAPAGSLGDRIAIWSLTTLVSSLLVSAWLMARARSRAPQAGVAFASLPRRLRRRPSR